MVVATLEVNSPYLNIDIFNPTQGDPAYAELIRDLYVNSVIHHRLYAFHVNLLIFILFSFKFLLYCSRIGDAMRYGAHQLDVSDLQKLQVPLPLAQPAIINILMHNRCVRVRLWLLYRHVVSRLVRALNFEA